MKVLRRLITVEQAEIYALAVKSSLLNDIVIEAYLRIVERRNWYQHVRLPLVYLFAKFFLKDWKEKKYRAVNGGHNRIHIFHNKMLFIPEHNPDQTSKRHWILIEVWNESLTISAQNVGRYKSFSNTRRGEDSNQLIRGRSWNRNGIFRNRKTRMNIMASIAGRQKRRAESISGVLLLFSERAVLALNILDISSRTILWMKDRHMFKGSSGLVKYRILDEPLRADELVYPLMRHIDLFNPIYRPRPSLHPSPVEVNVTESSDDDPIALIDDVVRDLDVESVRQQGTNIDSERPVSPCLSIGGKARKERGSESLGPEDVKSEGVRRGWNFDREEKLHRTKIINIKNDIQRESGYTERLESLKESTSNTSNRG
ncbi:hypothetical protein J6590_073839 [Homalodisca vitripennis]|nr:hypothetical protein J6590_073839 [Homalodisca vitripennis]